MRARPLSIAIMLALGCGRAPSPRASSAPAAAPLPHTPLSRAEYTTTDGEIALGNFDSVIRRLESDPSAEAGTALVDALLSRAQVLGELDQYDRAEALAESLVRRAPKDPDVYLARAAARAAMHRFTEAQADLDRAGRDIHDGRVEQARATILQALGRYDEALALREMPARIHPTLMTVGAVASVYADRGDLERADSLFLEAQQKYRDTSPFPLAAMYLQEGLMFQRAGRLSRARELFAAAVDRVPRYAPAVSHLAAVEAMTGERERAIVRLRRLVTMSNDPEYLGQLGELTGDAGLVARARARYDELLARHPDAFADHAARFFLGPGADANRALALAQRNLRIRPTAEARQLVAAAERAL